jgi:phospholipid/cholesterol/gamma-HCH transport system ATP-binding protein
LILLVDEPSSGLDRITAGEIDELLLKIKHKKKTTMVIVTHDIHGARRVGDQIAVLDGGHLVAIGTAQALEQDDNPLVRALTSEKV